MRTKTFFFIRLLLACWLSFSGITQAWAWDSEPDGNGKYDGLFDRPTYFPTWEQPATWPNAMYYLCEVRMSKDQAILENYEIAVFDQDNQLRHCNRSIATDGHHCVLTIRGEEGDSFYFKVIYGDDFKHPVIAEIENATISFKTNDIVGGDTPYVLTVYNGDPDGISPLNAARSKAACRYYDMQGRLVAHPTKGIYVCRAENGSSRIIVIK